MNKFFYSLAFAILVLGAGSGAERAQATDVSVLVTNLFGCGDRFYPANVAASADGQWVAFSVFSDSSTDPDTLGIWIVRSDGSDLTQVLSYSECAPCALDLYYLSWGGSNTLYVKTNWADIWKLTNFLPPPSSVQPGSGGTSPTIRVTPNPSTKHVGIQLTLTAEQQVEVAVYDVAGRKVETLRERSLAGAGPMNLTWKPTSGVSGVYFIRVRGETFLETSRAVFVK